MELSHQKSGLFIQTLQEIGMTKDQTYSREDALESATFLRLYLGALKIEDETVRVRTVTVILLAGRLGLRASEIQHIHEGWIDWDRGVIRVPAHDPCFCKWCIDSARGKIATERGVEKKQVDPDEEDVLEYAYENQYEPKPGASARVVPFGWSRRITAWLLHFFDRNEFVDVSQEQLRNNTRRAADLADGVNPDNLTPHPLRATGATFFADAGLLAKPLRDLMGWSDRSQARRYVRGSGRQLTSKVYEMFGKKKWAPDAIPDDPENVFPVACDPQPFASEIDIDALSGIPEARMERSQQRADKKEPVYNPRRKRRPDHLPYNPDDHTIPGHVDPDGSGLEDPDVERVDVNHEITEFVADRNEQSIAEKEGVDRRQDVSDYGSSGEDRASTEPAGAQVTARLSYEYDNVEDSANIGYQGPRRTIAAIGAMILGSVIFGVTWALTGPLGQIFAGDLGAIFSLGVAGLITLPYLVWSTHEATYDNPQDVEPQTRLDRVIIKTHSMFDKIVAPLRRIKEIMRP